MALDNEETLERLREALSSDFDAKNLEGLFAVIAEDVLDALDKADAAHLASARRELRRSYALLAAQEPEAEDTAAFVLGRVSGLLELVGAASERQEPIEFRREMANEKNRKILELLRDGEKASKEIEVALGMDKGQLSKWLQKLEAVGVIVRQKSGRRIYSRLSLAAQTALDEDELGGGRASGFERFGLQDIADVLRRRTAV